MKKFKSILNIMVLVITAPFNILLKSNAISNPNKRVQPWLVLCISLLIVALFIFLYYFAGEVFKW